MSINKPSEFVLALRNPYAWPGGYPCYFIMDDCESMCFKCATKEKRRICSAISERDRCGWTAQAVAINWEYPDLYCCHCGDRIESAYAEEKNAPPNVFS